MNSGSYFEIGNTHQVCQDYALSGNYKDMYYGIVSDGCSSAEHSEIGAQILCHVAQYNLQLHYDLFIEDIKQTTLMSLLGNNILRRADELRKLYPISRDALQATLLIALVINGKGWMFGWGDGYFIMKGVDLPFPWIVTKIDYPQTNAPFYLCADQEVYVNKFGEGLIVRETIMSNLEDKGRVLEYSFYTPYFSSISLKPGDMLTIMTDGLGQYLDRDKKPITDLAMVPLVIDYPSTEGVFVERTMNFLKKDLTRKGWTHADDVGIATIMA
jgi:serine/threonine protein phosphatase PrpC